MSFIVHSNISETAFNSYTKLIVAKTVVTDLAYSSSTFHSAQSVTEASVCYTGTIRTLKSFSDDQFTEQPMCSCCSFVGWELMAFLQGSASVLRIQHIFSTQTAMSFCPLFGSENTFLFHRD